MSGAKESGTLKSSSCNQCVVLEQVIGDFFSLKQKVKQKFVCYSFIPGTKY